MNNMIYLQVDQDDPRLVEVVRNYWLHPPSAEPYDLIAPQLSDFSMGQSLFVDTILKGKVNKCYYLQTTRFR